MRQAYFAQLYKCEGISFHCGAHTNMYTPVCCKAFLDKKKVSCKSHGHRVGFSGPALEVITVHAAHFHSSADVQASLIKASVHSTQDFQRSVLFRRVWKFCPCSYNLFSSSYLCYTLTVFVHLQLAVLAFCCPRQLCEFALVVDHLQVLNVVSDVAGISQREAVV